MTEESVITEELRNMVGVEAEPEVLNVEKGHIRRFAEAVGDPNPLWQDEAYAGKSRYGSIIGPPMFLQDEGKNKIADRLMEKISPAGFLNGGVEVEFYKPMIPGDIITTRAKLTDLYEKQGKSGKLIFMVIEVTFTNQRGELVSISRNTFIGQ
ncbi:MaoC family dehydratase N-terminal domain-containing protein [Chloroflexota bacterium]